MIYRGIIDLNLNDYTNYNVLNYNMLPGKRDVESMFNKKMNLHDDVVQTLYLSAIYMLLFYIFVKTWPSKNLFK